MKDKSKREEGLGARIKNEDSDNLGLDADHSTDTPSLKTRLNDDNDRISGNPDGENDVGENYSSIVHSPLDDK